MKRNNARLRRALARTLSYVLGAMALLSAVAWALGPLGGVSLMRNVVLTQSDGTEVTTYQRGAATSRGRVWFAYVRAEVLEESARGRNEVRWYLRSLPSDENVQRYNAPEPLAMIGIDWQSTATNAADASGHYVYREVLVSLPHWLFVTIGAGGWWTIGRRGRIVRRRVARGLCPACGYDVRATPDRCPECGAAAA